MVASYGYYSPLPKASCANDGAGPLVLVIRVGDTSRAVNDACPDHRAVNDACPDHQFEAITKGMLRTVRK